MGAAIRVVRERWRGLYYGWVVVGVTTLMLLVSAGVRSAPGVFLLPVELSLGLDRATVALSVSLGLVLYGAAGPLSVWLLGRFGVRRLATLGLLLTAVGMVMSLGITQAWHLTLSWGLLSGVGTGIVGSVLGAAVAARWFVAKRGLVVGIFGAAMSAGQLIFVPLLMSIASGWGWRIGGVLLAAIAAAVVIPAVVLMRSDPSDKGLRPYGAPETGVAYTPPAVEKGVMGRAVRTNAFWLLAGTFFICGATSNGIIGTHLIPYAVECGIPQSAAAGSLALLGAMNFVGTILSGWLTDRFDPRKLLLIFYGFRGLDLLALPFVDNAAGLSLFAAVFGLDYIATVPPTTSLIADRFGRANVGIVYGWVFFAHQMGAAGAAWLGGVARDAQGDYQMAFMTAGAIAILAAVLALGIRTRTPAEAPLPA